MRSATLIVSLAVVLCTQAAAGAQIGKTAPDFEALDSQGKTHRLSDYLGRVVVLEWTNHQCPFVRKH